MLDTSRTDLIIWKLESISEMLKLEFFPLFSFRFPILRALLRGEEDPIMLTLLISNMIEPFPYPA
jgi:hypothetical protein